MATPYRRLLLASEHSEFDTGAEALALALARHWALPLAAVMPVVSNPELESAAPELAARLDEQASTRREALETMAAAQQVPIEVSVRRGQEPYAEIVADARERNADLIVIRRRGHRGLLANLLVGEMVSKVVAHAPCDVLVNGRMVRLWSRRIVAAVDPGVPDAAVVERAARVASSFALPLTLVGAVDADDRLPAATLALQRTLASAQALGVEVDAQVRVGRAHDVVIESVRRCQGDLIVIGRHGAQRLPRAWIGGVAQKVLGLAECPVLVCAAAKGPSA